VLVTLVAAEKNCFQEPFKALKTVGISGFNWQRVPDCQASVIEIPTVVHAKLAARWWDIACPQRLLAVAASSECHVSLAKLAFTNEPSYGVEDFLVVVWSQLIAVMCVSVHRLARVVTSRQVQLLTRASLIQQSLTSTSAATQASRFDWRLTAVSVMLLRCAVVFVYSS